MSANTGKVYSASEKCSIRSSNYEVRRLLSNYIQKIERCIQVLSNDYMHMYLTLDNTERTALKATSQCEVLEKKIAELDNSLLHTKIDFPRISDSACSSSYSNEPDEKKLSPNGKHKLKKNSSKANGRRSFLSSLSSGMCLLLCCLPSFLNSKNDIGFGEPLEQCQMNYSNGNGRHCYVANECDCMDSNIYRFRIIENWVDSYSDDRENGELLWVIDNFRSKLEHIDASGISSNIFGQEGYGYTLRLSIFHHEIPYISLRVQLLNKNSLSRCPFSGIFKFVLISRNSLKNHVLHFQASLCACFPNSDLQFPQFYALKELLSFENEHIVNGTLRIYAKVTRNVDHNYAVLHGI